jgi:Cof subfamily protein (haloacid dehalogenase superfamily)
VIANLPSGIIPGGRFDQWRPTRPGYVVCDVDGTLIGPSALSSPEVVDAFARALAAGLRVGYATGRARDAVARLHEQLAAPGPHVLHNGAEIRLDGVTMRAWNLTPRQVDDLLTIARGRDDTYVEIYLESGYMVSAEDERARPHWEILGSEPSGLIAAAAELEGRAVMKATFAVFDPSIVDEIEAHIAAIGLLAGTAGSPRTPDLVYVNATHPEADKGRAVVHAAAELGIGLEEVVAVGDASNDLSMLAVAGTAIAMGQAPDAIKAAAHLIVPDVASHGVATALDAAVAWRRG